MGTVCVVMLLIGASIANAQVPVPGTDEPRLGTPPGSRGELGVERRDTDVVGGRPGPAVPPIGPTYLRPGVPALEEPPREGMMPIPGLPEPEPPRFGPVRVPSSEREGPTGGLTLEAAIARLLRSNLELKALAMEITKARADLVTAGLRDNPILFFDSQMIPYGSYSPERPGGPVQYDLNLSYPIDVTRKRMARVRVADRTARVIVAQYRDAVRLTIDELYTAFLDALAAREAVRFAEAAIEGLDGLLEQSEAKFERGEANEAEVERLRVRLDQATIGLMEARSAEIEARAVLSDLLDWPVATMESLQVRGSIVGHPPDRPPDPEALVRLALARRPDLVAYRLGLDLAAADLDLSQARRLEDVFLLYQPFTYQDNRPFDARSATSWAIGLTVPLPMFNRNQGNIHRARINVSQTRIELADLERQVASQVRRAVRSYALTDAAVRRVEESTILAARRAMDAIGQQYIEGSIEFGHFLQAREEYLNILHEHRDLLIRRRRAMFQINTAVAERVFP